MERGLSVEPASPRGIPSDQDCGSFSNLSLPAVVNRYPVNADATLGKGELFFDLTMAGADDAIDGIKVDKAGNLFVSGPGGLWILSPEGKHLGTLHGPEHPHNMAWGDADRQTLYLAAQTGIYRIRLSGSGTGAFAAR